jgi:hypothetical protein
MTNVAEVVNNSTKTETPATEMWRLRQKHILEIVKVYHPFMTKFELENVWRLGPTV